MSLMINKNKMWYNLLISKKCVNNILSIHILNYYYYIVWCGWTILSVFTVEVAYFVNKMKP